MEKQDLITSQLITSSEQDNHQTPFTMNQLKAIFTGVLCLLFTVELQAQMEGTATHQGSAAASKEVNFNGERVQFDITVGGLIGESKYIPVPPTSTVPIKDIISGFPFDINYFPAVFGSNLFVSKGYFGDRVELKWDIISQLDNISRFSIYRKRLGIDADSTLLARVDGNESSYNDSNIQFGTTYEYTLFAEGIADDLRLPFVNMVSGVGFALPNGSVSGRVTFEGGTAVQGVNIIAETTGALEGRSVYLNGTDASLSVPNSSSLALENGFTLQMWLKSEPNGTTEIFRKGSDYQLSYDQSTIQFRVGASSVNLPFVNPVDSFFHVAATYDATSSSISLQAFTNQPIQSPVSVSGVVSPPANSDGILFGGSSGNHFKGNLDEIRLWSVALDSAAISSNANSFIASNTEGLAAYWKVQVGVGNEFFDSSNDAGIFNENHGFLNNATWSSATPKRTQVSYRGVTDVNGSYFIEGIPFESAGSVYRFVPLFGLHTFDPNEQTRILGPGASVQNGVDFTDISSFEFSGFIRYFNTRIPVNEVRLLIDGQPAINADGNIITSDATGAFSIDVPIGFHRVQVEKNGHVFVNEGRFSPLGSPDFDFQEPISGVYFVDSTFVKVAGRAVGGPVEAEKKLGFGESKDNVGNSRIVISPTNTSHRLTIDPASVVGRLASESVGDSTVLASQNQERFVKSNARYESTRLVIDADTATGEFIAFLPPESFKIDNAFIISNNSPFPGAASSLDLRNPSLTKEVKSDTIGIKENGLATLVPSTADLLPGAHDSLFTTTEGIFEYTIVADTFSFSTQRSFVLRNSPTLEVLAQDGSTQFGDTSATYTDVNGVDQEVNLLSLGLAGQVFTQGRNYSMNFELFEEYVNADNPSLVDIVPVVDGKIQVDNQLTTTGPLEIDLNDSGQASYQFSPGAPTLAGDFSQPINITAFSGENGAISTAWGSNPFKGITFGSAPSGSNFVTNGPTEVFTILRDPAGSNSYAFIETGQSFTKEQIITNESAVSERSEIGINFDFTATVATGIGVAVVETVGTTLETSYGSQVEETDISTSGKSQTITFNNRIETSADPNFTGTSGDLFVGSATNLVYGLANFVGLVKNGASFEVGTDLGIRVNPEFTTEFLYTQSDIENTIIPDLINLRNQILLDPGSTTTAINDSTPAYVSKVPRTHEGFGLNNDDPFWGAAAADTREELVDGPSYEIILHPTMTSVSDTIFYFNQQIGEWEFWLEENERQKVEAETQVNRSFSAGFVFQESFTSSYSSVSSRSFEWRTSNQLAINQTVVGPVGGVNNLNINFSEAGSETTSSTSVNTTTYGYVLSDPDIDDSHTMDIKNPADGFGPVFSVRGGVTSCPYQDSELTKYFEPGQHVLHEATVRLENPQISAVQNVITDIPGNSTARFTIQMSNDIAIERDVYFDVIVPDPKGLQLRIDGAPIAGGRTFLIEAGQQLTKVIEATRTADNAPLDYEDIEVLMVSRCQYEPADNTPDIFDLTTITAKFQANCTAVDLISPVNNWLLNTNAAVDGVVQVEIGNYDRSFDDFSHILFQYRAEGSSDFITDRIFYNDPADVDPNAGNEDAITGANIVYAWDMSDLPDRSYEIRAVSICDVGSGNLVETPSAVHVGLKDTFRPVPFGSPQPADGVLSANDEISIRFNEPIDETAIPATGSIVVQGVLNGSAISNGISVAFDGVNDFLRVENSLPLSASFTVEFWLQRDQPASEQIVFSQGEESDASFEIFFDTSNRLNVKYGTQTISSTDPFGEVVSNADYSWHHYAVSYSEDLNQLSAYRDGKVIIDQEAITEQIQVKGSLQVARSSFSSIANLHGAIHELRVWNSNLTQTNIAARRSISLSGTEAGLQGYWPLKETEGDLAEDKARARTANLFATWRVLPLGYAIELDGIDDYVSISTASTVVVPKEDDYTLELWFKGDANQNNTSLFSSGRGDGTEDPTVNDLTGNTSLGFNSNGDLELATNGQLIIVSKADIDLLDNAWHHLAISVRRLGNMSIYADGVQILSSSSDEVGGLLGNEMYIGARATKESIVNTTFDQFFRGSIDELRIWGLAKNAQQIALDKNRKIKGSEVELLAYYPFEENQSTGSSSNIFTSFDDQLIPGNNLPSGGTATDFGGITFTQQTPNIAQSRAVSTVAIDYVVNDDEIIITPRSGQEAAIENVILDISIVGSDIMDRNGNSMASGQTWTAFVDRNPMKWSEDIMLFEKEATESLSFQVDIVNDGGTAEAYTIEGLPAWLSAAPAAGTLNPVSSQTVTFTVVNELINIGDYTEDIRLVTGFGLDEVLLLTLDNYKNPPADWELDPSAFEESMNIIGQLSINSIISRDEDDIIAAFVDNEIRGTANLELIEVFDTYQVFLTIYSNEKEVNKEDIEFRVFDASAGIVRGGVTPVFTFSPNSNQGSTTNPILFQVGNSLVKEISYVAGFQWVSYNLSSPQLQNTNRLFQTATLGDGDLLKGQAYYDQFESSNGWLGSLSNSGGVTIGKAYKLRLGEATSLQYSGELVKPSTIPISVNQGWNWIGYIPEEVIELNEALGSLVPTDGDLIKSQFSFAIYNSNLGWVGTLKSMEPGKGYMLNSAASDVLVYPNEGINSASRISMRSSISKNDWSFNPFEYEETMSMIISVIGGPATINSESLLIGLVDESVRGTVTPIEIGDDDRQLFMLNLHGNGQKERVNFKLQTSPQGDLLSFSQQVDFVGDTIIGSIEHPFELVEPSILQNHNAVQFQIKSFPNPFKEKILFEGNSLGAKEVKIQIFDSTGKIVKQLENTISGSRWEVIWDVSNAITQGIYAARIQVGGYIKTVKISKK